jgi:hypothetical protein
MNKKFLTEAVCKIDSYRSPEVSVTEIFSEGVLCASGGVETWEEENNSSIWGN